MLGTLVKINSRSQSFALKTDSGYSIFNSQNFANSEIGDLLEFENGLPIGLATLTNKTKNYSLQVDFKAHNIQAEAAQRWISQP